MRGDPFFCWRSDYVHGMRKWIAYFFGCLLGPSAFSHIRGSRAKGLLLAKTPLFSLPPAHLFVEVIFIRLHCGAPPRLLRCPGSSCS